MVEEEEEWWWWCLAARERLLLLLLEEEVEEECSTEEAEEEKSLVVVVAEEAALLSRCREVSQRTMSFPEQPASWWTHPSCSGALCWPHLPGTPRQRGFPWTSRTRPWTQSRWLKCLFQRT